MYNTFANRLRRNRKGFTLIELLVVVLILAILMAVALPLYLSAVADSQLKTCRANMQTIASAVQAARVKAVAADYSTWTGAGTGIKVSALISGGNLADLTAAPTCPISGNDAYSVVKPATSLADGYGGTVAVPAGSFGVVCGTAAHGGFIPGAMAK